MPVSAMRHPSCVSRDYLPQLRVVPPTPLKPGEEQHKRTGQSPNHLREEEWLVYCGKPPAATPPKLAAEEKKEETPQPPSPVASEASTQLEASLWCQEAIDLDESLWNPDGEVSKQKQLYNDVMEKLADVMRTQLNTTSSTKIPLSVPSQSTENREEVSSPHSSSTPGRQDCSSSQSREISLAEVAIHNTKSKEIEEAPPISMLPVALKASSMSKRFRQPVGESPPMSPRSCPPVRRISTPRNSDDSTSPSLQSKKSPTRIPQKINYINMKVGSDEMKIMILPGVSVTSLGQQFSDKYNLKNSTRKKLEEKLQMLMELQS